MNVFLTGATGFLGRRVAKELLQQGDKVRCLVRPSSDIEPLRQFVGPELWDGIEIVSGELTSVDTCQRLIGPSDTVCHVAASLAGGAAVMFLNTVIPTRALLGASVRCQVRRFVQISSLGVYAAAGLSTGDQLDETTPLDPHPELRDPYTYSKIVQEQITWEAHIQSNLPVTVIRPGVIYGPGRGVLSNRVGLKLGPVLIKMGGSQTVPYTFVENCASAVALACRVQGADGEALNILDDGLPTGSQLLRKLRRAGQGIRSVWIPRPLIGPLSSLYEWYSRWSDGQLPGVITRYRSDSMWRKLRYTNAKAKRCLNWTPPIAFEEAFLRTIAEGTT